MYLSMKSKLYVNKEEKYYLNQLTRASKNLYNAALYNVRQHFFKENNHLSYVDNVKLLKHSINYKLLPTVHAQSTIRKVDEAMKAFFGSLKRGIKTSKLPRYLKRDGYYPLIDRMVYKPNKQSYSLPVSKRIQQLSFNGLDDALINNLQTIHKPKLVIKTPSPIHHKNIKEITIKPSVDGKDFYIHYVYLDTKEVLQVASDQTNVMGIDFGYNNLAFCATRNDHLLLDGKYIKSLNQWYHKRLAALASKRPNQNIITKQMKLLTQKRNHQMMYCMYKSAKLIIAFSLKHHINHIMMGYNKGFKDINLSKRYNQMARSIPIVKLKDRIAHLAKKHGIKVDIINESYTSKASFMDKEPLKPYDFSGTRIRRGLFKTKTGHTLNADLNAALNIIRKCNPEFEVGTRGLNTPKRTHLYG